MKRRPRLHWKDLLIGALWLLLWTTNRRRSKARFDEWRTRPWSHKLLDGVGFLMRREL